jgi:hypothetical protein
MIPVGIVLDTASRKLEAKLGAAGAIPVTVNFVDIIPQTKSDFSPYRPACKITNTDGTTAVTVCEAPAQGAVRVINYICVYNSDAGSETVTIQIDDGGTESIQVVITLATTESAIWTPNSGWDVVT